MQIKYTQLDQDQFTQCTLGPKSGYRIETESILLEPLLLNRDAPKLWELVKDHSKLFEYFPHGPCSSYEDFYAIQKRYCSAPDRFNWAVYLLVGNEKQKILCGSISLLDISLPFRRFEVGAIWFHPAVHSTFVMLETTYALLRFSFEQLHAGRVQWKTHHQNIASQKSALKLGFDLDGIHKKHLIHYNGQWRNSYYYSMTDDDWFGDHVTTDGRPGLDVVKPAEESDLRQESKGRQLRLEQLIQARKHEGKPLPESVQHGVALTILSA
ncbi:hypothetical protein BGZ74_006715 [Mortierella antarctica]|nr:hypothetical protein BGZ74_006715 [Mortierella antarctica]